MGNFFVTEGMVLVDDDHSIAAVDTYLMKAKGSVWHKSSMEKGDSTTFWHRYRCKVGL